jgi:hypothetical protein
LCRLFSRSDVTSCQRVSSIKNRTIDRWYRLCGRPNVTPWLIRRYSNGSLMLVVRSSSVKHCDVRCYGVPVVAIIQSSSHKGNQRWEMRMNGIFLIVRFRGVQCSARVVRSPSNLGRSTIESRRHSVFGSGGGGIRTHGRLAPTTVFKTVPIDHSGTPPICLLANLVDDVVGDEDRHIDRHRQRDRVARP